MQPLVTSPALTTAEQAEGRASDLRAIAIGLVFAGVMLGAYLITSSSAFSTLSGTGLGLAIARSCFSRHLAGRERNIARAISLAFAIAVLVAVMISLWG